MLKPDDRLTLLSALRPPAGYALDCAIGTTYSLDLYALLAAPLAFTGFEWESKSETAPVSDVQPLALLQALRRHASKLTIFCQAGAIHPPARHERLFTYLEDALVQVKAPDDNGVFHPKVWALRYTSEDDVIYRLLVSSRNLTYDRSWDTLLVLEGVAGERSQTVRDNARLGAFFEALPELAIQTVSQETRARARLMASELPYIKFDIPQPFTSMHFYPSGIPNGQTVMLPERVDRLLVVSPFVSDAHMRELADGAIKDVQLVSRLDSLAALSDQTVELLDRAYVLNDAATPEVQDPDSGDAQAPAQSALSGLHAKLYIADSGWDAVVLTGSANATHAAATANVEFMVELTGKRSACGVDVFLNGKDKRDDDGFATLLVEYPLGQNMQETDASQYLLERQAERVVLSLATASMSCGVAQADGVEDAGGTVRGGLYSLTLTGIVPATHEPAAVRCWPLSLGEARALAVPDGQVALTFDGVSLLSITPLFVFEVSISMGERSFVKQAVIKVPLDGAPAGRAEAVLIDMLSDAGAFARMLQLLMAGDEPLQLSTVFGASKTTGAHTSAKPGRGSALLESLLRTFERAPDRLDEIARMIDDMRTAQQQSQTLPDGFDRIWNPVWQARQQQKVPKRATELLAEPIDEVQP